MSGDDGRVWHVWSYPAEACLHTTTTYELAERWRRDNDTMSFIAPSWLAAGGDAR